MDDFNDRAFDLIPLETDTPNDTAPGSSCHARYADGFLDEWVEKVPFPTAGHVLHMDHFLHEK